MPHELASTPDKYEYKSKGKLEKIIEYPAIFLIIINSILGTGVFFTPGLTAKFTGVWVVFAWIFIGLLSILIATMFGELVERLPYAGGMYEYTKRAFGIASSFMVGWLSIIVGGITIAMLIIGAIIYLNPEISTLAIIFFGLFIIWSLAFMASRGLRTNVIMLIAFAIITLGVILISTFVGFLNINYNTSNILFSFDNFPGILPLALAIFLAADTFFGWESATYLSEEIKNARQTLPKAMRRATIFIVVVVIIHIFALLLSLGVHNLAHSQTPIISVFQTIYNSYPSLIKIISLLIYLSILGSVADWIVTSPRLVLAMARDKEMIPQLADIDEKTKVPVKAIFFQAILASIILIIGVGTYRVVLETLLPLTFGLYAFMGFVLLRLRKKQSGIKVKYPVLFGKVGIWIIIFFNISLIIGWLLYSDYAHFVIVNLFALIIMGLALFLLLNSFYNPDFIKGYASKTAKMNKRLEYLLLPKRIKKEIENLFFNIEKKIVLELGAGIGTLTLHLAEMVGAGGKVYAIEVDEKNIEILEERIRNRNIKHVEVIHDPHLHSRVHPYIKKVDIVFSLGLLSHVSDLEKLLKDISRVLPPGGKICIIDYVDFFRIMPNPSHLRNLKELEKLFRKHGFSVRIKKLKGALWNYIIIYGMKSPEQIKVI